MLASGFFTADDTVVLFNTGSGLKYLDVSDTKDAPAATAQASRAIAGIIRSLLGCAEAARSLHSIV